MAFTVNYSFNYNSADSSDYITNVVSSSFSATEVDKTTLKVPAGTLIGSPVTYDLSNLDPPRLIVVTTTGELQARFNAEVVDRAIKECFIYDGTDITTILFANSAASDYYVTIVVFA